MQHDNFIELAQKAYYHMSGLFSHFISNSNIIVSTPIENTVADFESFMESWYSLNSFDERIFLHELLAIDNQGRKAIFKFCEKCFNAEFVERYICNIDKLKRGVNKYGVHVDNVSSVLNIYISLSESLQDIAGLYEYKTKSLAELNIVKQWHNRRGHFRYYFMIMENDTTQIILPSLVTNSIYKKMPRTHRIAAVWGLIDHLKLKQSVDKTRLAAFVEAVTGGNIDARPQDTVSYKTPTKDAQEAAAELLKKIGIELNLGASDV